MQDDDSLKNKQSTNFTIVDAPDISLAEGENAGEVLLHFFRALGWNGDDYVDPSKIRTTHDVYYRLYDLMYEKVPNAISVGFHMVNRGPGVDDHIPQDKVHLLDGWIIPALAEGVMKHVA